MKIIDRSYFDHQYISTGQNQLIVCARGYKMTLYYVMEINLLSNATVPFTMGRRLKMRLKRRLFGS